jgi:6-phosphofructokinase 1
VANTLRGKKVGVFVGGGPAPGINPVICAVTIEAENRGAEVYGFFDGLKWLVRPDFMEHFTRLRRDPEKFKLSENYCAHLTIPRILPNLFRGGSLLRTSRTNPNKDPKDIAQVIDNLTKVGITHLVTIGGDDTALSASNIYKASKGAIRVAHVPKTIDNDLPLPETTPTFGFETARHVGSYLVRNLAEDAKTTSRWYLVVSMGRAAGHLALGIGNGSGAHLTIIPEEFGEGHITLGHVADLITTAIIKRRTRNKPYGVVILAEGMIEKIGPDNLRRDLEAADLNPDHYGRWKRDPFGQLRLGEIEFGRMMKDYMEKALEKLGLEQAFIDKDLGYELRSADPIPFDAEYCRDLGYAAIQFLNDEKSEKTGAIISFVERAKNPLWFEDMLNPETGKMRTRRVRTDTDSYRCARFYMARLERDDLSDSAMLKALADQVGMTPEQYQNRFAYLLG